MPNGCRQRSLKLLARIDQDVAEAESLIAETPLDDTKHEQAVDALPSFEPQGNDWRGC